MLKKQMLCISMLLLFLNIGHAYILDYLDNTADWKKMTEEGASVEIMTAQGKFSSAIKMVYRFGALKGVWVQIEKAYYQNLSTFNALSFWVKGSGTRANLQLKIEDMDGSVFGIIFEDIGMVRDWQKITVDFENLKYFWGGDNKMNWQTVKKIAFTITKSQELSGEVLVDQLELIKGMTRKLKPVRKQQQFYTVKKDKKTALKSLKWVKSLQKQSGLIQSYIGDKEPFAWTYDQAIALIMFAREDQNTAEKIARFFIQQQNSDGSWYDGYLADTGRACTKNKWIGSISWMIHALCEYINNSKNHQYFPAVEKTAQWILSQKKTDGFYHDSTEGNLDVWWALQATGHLEEAEELKLNLLKYRWDHETKRFYNTKEDATVFLDMQTWGACFTRAAGVPEYGLYSLAMAERELRCRTFDDNTTGLDGGGPYTVWFEGTLQYIVAGGQNADFYLREVTKHQDADGSIRHSHERHNAGTIWHTTMLHIAPAVWLYFANTETPFVPGVCQAKKN